MCHHNDSLMLYAHTQYRPEIRQETGEKTISALMWMHDAHRFKAKESMTKQKRPRTQSRSEKRAAVRLNDLILKTSPDATRTLKEIRGSGTSLPGDQPQVIDHYVPCCWSKCKPHTLSAPHISKQIAFVMEGGRSQRWEREQFIPFAWHCCGPRQGNQRLPRREANQNELGWAWGTTECWDTFNKKL